MGFIKIASILHRMMFFLKGIKLSTPFMVLKRTSEDLDCTLGDLYIEGELFCKTLENPYLENRQFVSSIPKGDYIVQRKYSPKFGETFHVVDVPNRSHILFHWGNFERDTFGCILVGDSHGKISGERVVFNSKKTFVRFMERLKDKEHFTLRIK